jgi:hypothetical protein
VKFRVEPGKTVLISKPPDIAENFTVRNNLARDIYLKKETMEHRKLVKFGIGILIMEMFLMGLWYYWTTPELGSALETLQIVLFLFGINLIIGLLLYFVKKSFALLLLANAVICPFVFYATWIMWFTYWAEY